MPSNQEVVEFVESFVARSKEAKRAYVPIWSEVLENYLVHPPHQGSNDDTGAPYYNGVQFGRSPTSYLKDPETKQVIDTLLSKLMVSLFGDDNFIAAKKRGREDAQSAETTTDLLAYFYSLDGHYRTTQVWLLDMLLFGTGISQLGWKLEERPRIFRDITGVDEFGDEIREEVRIPNFPVYDDPRLINIDLMDFFPDLGVDNMRDMLGCAKRVELTGFAALRNRGFNHKAVKLAIGAGPNSQNFQSSDDKNWRHERVDLGGRHPGFEPFVAFEYYGEVPYKYESGERWRVITIANGQVLRDVPWFYDDYRLPFYDATISPIQGRFYGLGPGEGARYQQDFLDFLLMSMADAVARTVSPPVAFDTGKVEDPTAMTAWRTDVPIACEGDPKTAIATVPYNPNMNNGMAFFNAVKQSMRENTGAFGSIQGAGLGINRASATEAERTFQMALDRPEMFAKYIEKECLPPLGRGILKSFQQNLETTEELLDRIGESPEPAILADIQGDFDVQFIGSRNYKNVQTKMASIDRLIGLMSALPQLANRLDWSELGMQILEGFGFDKIVQSMAVPEVIKENILLQQAASGGISNGNGAVPKRPQATTSQAQQGGRTVQ